MPSANKPIGISIASGRPQPPAILGRVLVAEDDPEMRRIVADALRKDGYAVVEAADGSECLRLAAESISTPEERFDLVLSDIRMPGLSGLDVVSRLRSLGARSPVVLMTAFGDMPTRIRASELDAVVLNKPFPIDAMRTVVAHLIGIVR